MEFNAATVALFDKGDDCLTRNDDFEGVREALRQAWALSAAERARFSLTRQGVARTPETERLCLAIDEAFTAREKALQSIESAVATQEREALAAGLAELEEPSAALLTAARALREEDGRTHVSPFPNIQDFIQAGRNVEQGGVPPEALKARLPALFAFIDSYEKRFAEDREAHPRFAQFAEEMEASFAALRDGAHIAAEFVEGGGAASLDSALRLLEEGSRRAEVVTREGRRFVVELSGASPITQVALLIARRKRLEEGSASPQAYAEAVSAIEALVALHRSSIDTLREAFAPLRIKERFVEELEKYLRAEEEALTSLLSDAPGVEKMRISAEFFCECWKEALAQIQDSQLDLALAPNILRLREAVRAAYEARAPRRLVKAVVEELEAKIRVALDEEMDAEERYGLRLQADGLAEMGRYFFTGAREHLVEGMEIVERGTAVLLDALKDRLAPHSPPPAVPASIPCIRCGAANSPGTHHCTSCGAYLAFSRTVEQETGSLAGGLEDEKELAFPIVRTVESLVKELRSGAARPDRAEEVVRPFLNKARSALAASRGQADRCDSPAQRQDVIHFVEATECLARGLEALLDGHLDEGLRLVQEAGRRFGELQAAFPAKS